MFRAHYIISSWGKIFNDFSRYKNAKFHTIKSCLSVKKKNCIYTRYNLLLNLQTTASAVNFSRSAWAQMSQGSLIQKE